MKLVPALAIAVMVPAYFWGQGPPPQRPPAVQASGEAVIQAEPDQAVLSIGVVTQAGTAQDAASQNANQLQTTLDRLRSALGSKGTIRTVGYSLNPVYSNPRDGSQPVIRAYSASNTVQVTTTDLAGLGKLIDSASQAGGANRIQGLQFSLKDDTTARSQALREAVRVARVNAEAMASGMGLKLGKVLLIDQGGSIGIRPQVREQFAAAALAPTPIEPGTVEVRANVTVTFELQ
jgi:uncharacterized protein YggE